MTEHEHSPTGQEPAGQEPQGLAMPGDNQPLGPPPAPPSFTRQAVQLVAIPAIIVAVCVGMAVLFGVMAGASDSLGNHLLKLRQQSGMGKLPLGMQDPRYKDRWLAAYNIATMIPALKDPAEKQRLSADLADILEHNVNEDEPVLQSYLMLAVGQLGQPGGLDVIRNGMTAKHPRARQGAVSAALSWPDPNEARTLIPELIQRLIDDHPLVTSSAAAALGQLAQQDDPGVIPALHTALDTTDTAARDARWNAAIALARLDDPRGSEVVATVLLNREQLHISLAGDTIDRGEAAQQDRVILSVLTVADSMTDPRIWDTIKTLADGDPNRTIRKAAKQLIMARNGDDPN